MWLNILEQTNKSISEDDKSKFINLRFELHTVIYIMKVLESKYSFELLDDELIIQDKKENIITKDEFYYWWQITRYQEIYSEELDIIKKIKEVENSIIKLRNSISNIKEKDETKKQKKIDDTETKIVKLSNYLNKEGPVTKQKLEMLSNFRNMINNKEFLFKLFDLMKIYLTYSD